MRVARMLANISCDPFHRRTNKQCDSHWRLHHLRLMSWLHYNKISLE